MPSKLPNFTLRIPAEMRTNLDQRARAERRTLANYVTVVLERHLAVEESRQAKVAIMPAAEKEET